MTKLVEVYGSLLNSTERKKVTTDEMGEVGKVQRKGWKLSFDRLSKRTKLAVLNLVPTGNPDDVYYTTVYRADEATYEAIMKREMGKITARKWKQRESICPNNYRPKKLSSEFGTTIIFIIPEEGRRPTPTNCHSDYVKKVREGIKESYTGEQRDINLQALERAIKESQINDSS